MLIKILLILLLHSTAWGAISLDGTDDYIDTNSTIFDFERTDPFTVMAWINHAGNASSEAIASNQQGDSTYRGWNFYKHTSDAISFDLINDDGTGNLITVQGTADIADGTWHFVAVVYDGSSAIAGVSFYADGASDAQASSSGTLSATTASTNDMTFGRRRKGSGVSELFYGGLIDHIAIWDTTLTGQEISFLYNARMKRVCLQVQPDNLVGYWELDGVADGVIATDRLFKDMAGGSHGTGVGGIGKGSIFPYP